MNDLYQSAVNFSTRTGVGLEVEYARHVYARFVKNNLEMKKALEHEHEEGQRGRVHVRNKRNFLGSIISTLTGLATGVCAHCQT